MSTATSRTTPAASSLAASAKVKTFVVTFAVAGTATYLLCLMFNWPLFTFHPATNRIALGWEAARSGEGPTMYWYGWTAMTVIVASVLATGATFIPEKRLPLVLIWVVPVFVSLFVWWNVRDTSGAMIADWRLWISLLIGFVLSGLGTMLPETVTRRIPYLLVWLLPVLAIPYLIYDLRQWWFHP